VFVEFSKIDQNVEVHPANQCQVSSLAALLKTSDRERTWAR